MTESTLEVANPTDILMLFGMRDQHLRALRGRYDVSITHRDGRIRVAGEHDQVRAAVRALKAMRHHVERHRALSAEDVQRILDEDVLVAREQVAREQVAREQVAREQVAREQVAREQVAREQVAREKGSLSSGGQEGRPVRSGDLGSSSEERFGIESRRYRGHGELRHSEIDLHSAGRRIRPRTEGQAAYVAAIRDHDLTFCSGPAGSGKTYLAVACAVEALKEHRVRKIVLVRPAVEAGENLGFLPGDLRAKLNPYLRPLLDAINEMIDFDQGRTFMEQDIIEVIPLAYMRGRTLNDAFIILDEAQNTTVAQMKMFLTRMGERSRMVVSGDASQVDLPRGVQSGLRDAMQRLHGIDEIGMIRLQKGDIVRHKLVQRIVHAYEGPEQFETESSVEP